MQTLIRGSSLMGNLAYCDYIAHTIVKPALEKDAKTDGGIMKDVGLVKMDLCPKAGYMVSTLKTVIATDVNGNRYKISIEQI